jgi:hypothetical protein
VDQRASRVFGVPSERRRIINCPGNLGLLIYNLDLFIDHLSGKPVDGDMDPVMLFPFNDEIVLQASSVWFVVPALCNHIDQQVPSTRLRVALLSD